MSFSLNPTSLANNSLATTEINFVNKYGSYADKYDDITPLGEQKQIWFYIITILSAVLSTILFIKSKEQVDANNKPIERTTTETLLRILAWLTLIIFVGGTIYSGYMYFLIYLPQYYKWFNELPIDAKRDIAIIETLSKIVGSTRPRYY